MKLARNTRLFTRRSSSRFYIIHVQQMLRHRNITSTMLYITLEQGIFQSSDDEFPVAVAKTVVEACKLVETGFNYVTEMNGARIFRKRK